MFLCKSFYCKRCHACITCISKYVYAILLFALTPFVVSSCCHMTVSGIGAREARAVLTKSSLPAQDSLLFEELAAHSIWAISHFDSVAASLRTLKQWEHFAMVRLVHLLGVTLLSGFIDLLAANNCDLYAARGQSLALPFAFHGLDKLHLVRWTHDNKIIFYREKGRVSQGKEADVAANGSLLLSDLQASAAGLYQVNVLHPNATPADSWRGRLCVEEKVLKPQLDYNCNFQSAVVNLDCLVANPRGLVFLWALDGKHLERESGQRLSVSLVKLKGQGSFTCSVANQVSKAESDAVRPACKSPPPPPPPPPPPLPNLLCYTSITVKAVLAGGACLILLLLTIVIVQCCSSSKSSRARATEKQDVRMVAISQEQPRSVRSEYETMRSMADSPPPSPEPSVRNCYDRVSQPDSSKNEISASHLSATAEMKQPSPVPKPRTKAPLSPKTYTNN